MQQVFFRKPTSDEANTCRVKLIQEGYPQVKIKQDKDGFWEVIADTVREKMVSSGSSYKTGNKFRQ